MITEISIWQMKCTPVTERQLTESPRVQHIFCSECCSVMFEQIYRSWICHNWSSVMLQVEICELPDDHVSGNRSPGSGYHGSSACQFCARSSQMLADVKTGLELLMYSLSWLLEWMTEAKEFTWACRGRQVWIERTPFPNKLLISKSVKSRLTCCDHLCLSKLSFLHHTAHHARDSSRSILSNIVSKTLSMTVSNINMPRHRGIRWKDKSSLVRVLSMEAQTSRFFDGCDSFEMTWFENMMFTCAWYGTSTPV